MSAPDVVWGSVSSTFLFLPLIVFIRWVLVVVPGIHSPYHTMAAFYPPSIVVVQWGVGFCQTIYSCWVPFGKHVTYLI